MTVYPEHYDYPEICDICGHSVENCKCPKCPECGEIGNPDCKINKIGRNKMTRKDIIQKIQDLQIKKDERLGNMASHRLDLSDEFERTKTHYNTLISNLQQQLGEIK